MLEAAFIEARHSRPVNPAFSGTAAIHRDHAQRGRARGGHRRAHGVTGVTAGTGPGSQRRLSGRLADRAYPPFGCPFLPFLRACSMIASGPGNTRLV